MSYTVALHYSVAFHYSGAPALEMTFGSCAEVYVYIRQLNNTLGDGLPDWYDISLYEVTGEIPSRIVSYNHRTNEEEQNDPSAYIALPSYLRNALARLQRHLMKNRAAAYAANFLHQAVEDLEQGGVLVEQDLLDAGFSRGTTKTHPGYWPRSETPLAECLELYNGAFGVGLKEHYPRYDTKNYHYVRYWLLDLEACDYGTES